MIRPPPAKPTRAQLAALKAALDTGCALHPKTLRSMRGGAKRRMVDEMAGWGWLTRGRPNGITDLGREILARQAGA